MNNSIKLTKSFYDKKAILVAINAFREIAQFELKEDNEYFYCLIHKSIYDNELTINEFSNYILGTMNQ